jgi:hypothetical protein
MMAPAIHANESMQPAGPLRAFAVIGSRSASDRSPGVLDRTATRPTNGASVEMKWLNGWSAAATFEGELSNVTSSYAG